MATLPSSPTSCQKAQRFSSLETGATWSERLTKFGKRPDHAPLRTLVVEDGLQTVLDLHEVLLVIHDLSDVLIGIGMLVE